MNEQQLFEQIQHAALIEIGGMADDSRQCAARAHIAAGVTALIDEVGAVTTAKFLVGLAVEIRRAGNHLAGVVQ